MRHTHSCSPFCPHVHVHTLTPLQKSCELTERQGAVRRLAHQSWQFNTKNPTFRKLFPEYLQPPPSSSPDPPPSGRGRPQPGHKVKAAPAEPPSSEPSSSARGGVGRGGEARESDPANHATSPGGSAAGGVGAGAQQAPEAAGGSEGSEDVGGNNDLPGKEQEQAAANKEAISQAIQDAMQQLRVRSGARKPS